MFQNWNTEKPTLLSKFPTVLWVTDLKFKANRSIFSILKRIKFPYSIILVKEMLAAHALQHGIPEGSIDEAISNSKYVFQQFYKSGLSPFLKQ